jgi:HD-like signal output (HDOD) protein/CheY-like chemotaxis protein
MSQSCRRVLLVDDEQKIVDGLQRVLRPYRAHWEVTTATSSTAALAMMEVKPFDVIVSDMRMPEMDGAALLAAAKEKYPTSVRIILSGQTDAQAALRTVGVAHQFLSKPTEPGVLIATLNRAVHIRDQICDPAVLAAVGSLGSLPSVPKLCHRLTSLVSGDEISVTALVAEIEREPAIVLKLLQLVNSAFFGLRRPMANVAQAVTYLGTDLIKNLVVSLSIVNGLPLRARRFDADTFQRRSVQVAQLARCVGGKGEHGDAAFVAGMLHDVGKLTLAFAMPELYDSIVERSRKSGLSFEEEEAAHGGCGHRKIGAYLVDLWGLPVAVVETLVEYRHVHEREDAELRAADALYIALELVESLDGLDSDSNRSYLARVGALERLPEFVARARELGLES